MSEELEAGQSMIEEEKVEKCIVTTIGPATVIIAHDIKEIKNEGWYYIGFARDARSALFYTIALAKTDSSGTLEKMYIMMDLGESNRITREIIKDSTIKYIEIVKEILPPGQYGWADITYKRRMKELRDEGKLPEEYEKDIPIRKIMVE